MPFSFLNKILLLGTLAFLIPLIIHLLNKRRLQTIEWGPMHLLREAQKQKRRRPRLEKWLLLLVRMLIPVLLALGLAVPAIKHFGLFTGSPPRATAYAVDNSPSMRTLEGASTRLSGARGLLEKIGGDRPSGSHSILLTGSAAPVAVENDNPLAVVESEDGLRAAGGFSPAEALRRASAALGETDEAAREIVLVTDFQKDDWTGPGREAIRDALAEIRALDPSPAITFLRAGGSEEAASGSGNLALVSVEPSVPVVAPRQPLRLLVNVRRSAQGALPDDFRIELRGEGGALLDESDCRCGAGESTQVVFKTQFEKEGDHPLEVRIRTTDALAADNVRHLVVPVWPHLKVLLLEGDRGQSRLAPVDFLEFALQPNRSAGLQGVDLVSAGRVRYDQFNESHLRDVRVAVLLGAPRLDEGRLKLLTEFVDGGGGLLVLPGPDAQLSWYRDQFFKGGEGLLPAPLGDRERLSAGEGVVLDGERLFHPVTAFFKDEGNGRVSDGRVRSYYRIDETAAPDLATLLQLKNGAPFLVEKLHGKGRVALMASTVDPDWSNLPLQPFFVPLLQRLCVHLSAGTTLPANVQAGENVAIEVPREWREKEVILVDPAGRETTLEVGEGEKRTARVASESGAGFYRFRRPPGKGDGERVVAASLPADDSKLLSETEVATLVEELGVGFAGGLEDYRALDKDRSFGRVVWRWFAYALLAFLFLELFIQQWMARRV